MTRPKNEIPENPFHGPLSWHRQMDGEEVVEEEIKDFIDRSPGIRNRISVSWSGRFYGNFSPNPFIEMLKNLGFIYDRKEQIWHRFMSEDAIRVFFEFIQQEAGKDDFAPPSMSEEDDQVVIYISDEPFGFHHAVQKDD